MSVEAVETQTAETEVEETPSMEDALNGALDAMDSGDEAGGTEDAVGELGGADAAAAAGEGGEADAAGDDDAGESAAGAEADAGEGEAAAEGEDAGAEAAAEGAETDEGEEAAAEPQLVDGRDITKAPTSWKAEASAEFDKLPEAVRREIHRREEDIHRGIEQYKGAAQFGSDMAKVVQPYRETLESLQVAPSQLMDAALQFEKTMHSGSPEQRVEMFQRLAQAYGLEVGENGLMPSQTPGEGQSADPRYQQLEQKYQTLEQKMTEREQAEQQREAERQREAVRSEIAEFRKDPKNGLYDVVQDQMARLLKEGSAETLRQAYDISVLQNPTALERLKSDMEFIGQVKDDVLNIVKSGQGADLKDAYDKAIWINPATRSKLISRQKDAERKSAAEKAAAAKKADQLNVASRATPSEKASGKGTTDEALNAALDEVMG